MNDSWLNLSTKELAYHVGQYEGIYESTKAFCDYIDELGLINKPKFIIDVACGGGANTRYMHDRWSDCFWEGIDINEELIKMAKARSIDTNIDFYVGNLYNISKAHKASALICLQTLSWLPSFKEPWETLLNANADFVAVSSLFYDGGLSYTINVCDHDTNKMSYYNIYSLDIARFWAEKYGYKLHYKKFDIGIDLEQPQDKGRGTYTVKTNMGDRLQISGALMMPWYFVVAVKK